MDYHRILIKLSGESLAGQSGSSSELFDFNSIHAFCEDIQSLHEAGIEIAIVLGAGNIMRGNSLSAGGQIDKISADYMGMMATHINALALEDCLISAGLDVRLMSAYPIGGHLIFEPQAARRLLSEGNVLVLSGGTGNPCVTTDYCAALRAIELGADVMLKATKVDGIYSEDPVLNPKATFFSKLSYEQVVDRNLKVMDLSGYLLCKDYNMPIMVFSFFESTVSEVLSGRAKFSLVSNES